MKKHRMLLGALLWVMPLCAMNEKEEKKEHWSVTLYRQYPSLVTVLKNSGLVWGGAQLVRGLFPLLNIPVIEGAIADGTTIVLIGSVIYDSFIKKPTDTITTLVECPVEQLRHNHVVDKVATEMVPGLYTLFKKNGPADWIHHPDISV